jgi:hypothetical protein
MSADRSLERIRASHYLIISPAAVPETIEFTDETSLSSVESESDHCNQDSSLPGLRYCNSLEQTPAMEVFTTHVRRVWSSVVQAAEDRTKLRCVRNNLVVGWKEIAEKIAIAVGQERLPTVPRFLSGRRSHIYLQKFMIG